VKWVEASGARAAPLHADWPWARIETTLRSVNGSEARHGLTCALMGGGGLTVT